MRSVLFVNQYFWPDMAATSQLLADLTEDLAAGGASVSVLAGRSRYAVPEGQRLEDRALWRGVDVRRVWSTDFGKHRLLGRVLDYGSFLASASLRMAFGRRFGIVVCLSTPPLVGVLGLIAKFRGARFVYKVEDLYPEVAIALGLLRARSLWARLLTSISRRLVTRADAVVTLDAAMAGRVEGNGARSVEIIPNWSDGQAIRPMPGAGSAFRSRAHAEGRFLVLYSGNMGEAHRFDAVIDAARELEKARPEIRFLFVGGGTRVEEVKRAAVALSNVSVLGYQPRDQLNSLFNAADVHLITLRDEVRGLLVPSKYSSALAAGKPVLLVGGIDTDMASEIREYGVGWVCGHRSDEVVAAVVSASDRRAEAPSMKDRSRRLFERKYDRAPATASWHRLLSGL